MGHEYTQGKKEEKESLKPLIAAGFRARLLRAPRRGALLCGLNHVFCRGVVTGGGSVLLCCTLRAVFFVFQGTVSRCRKIFI
jgi:hypothetical protein